jgi:hypothetical protein
MKLPPFQLHPSVVVNFLFDRFLHRFGSYGAHSAIWVVAYDGWYFAVPSDVFLGWESIYALDDGNLPRVEEAVRDTTKCRPDIKREDKLAA